MEFLKALFEGGPLTWEEFSAKVAEKGFKVADLSKGNYVAKKKYEDDLATKETAIEELNTQLKGRDGDIANLKKQLEDGSKDNETKISDLTAQLGKLQGDYDTARKDFEGKLSKQAYEFAVKEFAAGKKFTSNAAKRDFINEMLSAELEMKDDKIEGADDFASKYKEANTDAFVVEPADGYTPDNNLGGEDKPFFVKPTPPTPKDDTNGFNFGFHSVR